uniref:Tenascin-N-like n=1 Tax=Crassostrea virginica TaxID=6565 RepID=A0A8B8BIK5_CRAVI|nr:tenascin-N-like [Crassostrea virginica]
MRVHLYLLVCAIICAQLKYSSSQVAETFGNCPGGDECPDFSSCVAGVCTCDTGYVALDLLVQSAAQPVTVCTKLGPCSTFDNDESDCGTNGECVTYIDTNGIPTSFCKCSAGYYGPNCNSLTTEPYSSTTRPTINTTKRPGNYRSLLPIIGGGALLLLLLAGGGAALASTSG